MIDWHTVDYHPTYLPSRVRLLIFLVAEKFHIHGVKITEKYTVSQKIEFVYFCSCPQVTAPPPGSYHYHSRQEEITHFSQTMLFENLFFPAESGKDYEAEKMTKIKLVTGLDKSHHLCNLFTLFSVLLYHNLNSS